MSSIKRLSITLSADVAAILNGAITGGDYASNNEVVQETLRDWKMRRAMQLQELASLKAGIH